MRTTTHVLSHTLSAENLLGGKLVLKILPVSLADWVSLIRKGLPAGAVDALLRNTRLSQSELCIVLSIPERTLVRRKREGILTCEESDKLVRLARVIQRAEEVFEALNTALEWLQSPNHALGGVTPLSLLDTDMGAESVLDTLGRIEHGVFA